MSEKPKRKRCPNGTRKDKKTGECKPKKKEEPVKKKRMIKIINNKPKKEEPVKKKRMIKIIKNKPKKEEPVREKKKTIRITGKKKKEKPEPAPAPPNMEGKTITGEQAILDNWLGEKVRDAVVFTRAIWAIRFYLGHIMRKNKNDCVLRVDNRVGLIHFNLDSGLSFLSTDDIDRQLNTNDYKKIADRYLECMMNNKMLVIPVSMNFSYGGGTDGAHQNMLIFNYHRNELEKYEPHGEMADFGGLEAVEFDEAYNKDLKNMVKEINRYLPNHKKFIFKISFQGCPSDFTAWQATESIQTKNSKKFKDKLFPEGIKVESDSGYCVAWSMFYLDLRLKNPKVESKELYTVVEKNIIMESKGKFKAFLRGLTKELYAGMIQIFKEIRLTDNAVKVVMRNLVGHIYEGSKQQTFALKQKRRVMDYLASPEFFKKYY